MALHKLSKLFSQVSLHNTLKLCSTTVQTNISTPRNYSLCLTNSTKNKDSNQLFPSTYSPLISNLVNNNVVTNTVLRQQWKEISTTTCNNISLFALHKQGYRKKKRARLNPLGEGIPMARGIVVKTLIKHPRKPNSANRKCVLVRIPKIGKEMVAYIPGEGHNLKEHDVVLVIPKPLRDTPGVKLTCIRGARDLSHVIKNK